MDGFNSGSPYPAGVISFLDTDLYKLTMQSAIYKHFRDVPVAYSFTNRTPEKKFSRKAFDWLCEQVRKLGNISLLPEELRYLKQHCPYLDRAYLDFLSEFRLRPREQVFPEFRPLADQPSPPPGASAGGGGDELGDIGMRIQGTWSETILYEIPILALTSEAYFRFMDTDWDYSDQEERAFDKGMRLLEAGCIFSEFGTRRRRDYHTQALVFRGLTRASREAAARGLPGKLSGTSNVHLAMRFDIAPVGTVAHEWFMGIAAITGDYRNASETALRHWVGCFGEGVLGIALTDTFGTTEFLRAFAQPVRPIDGADGEAPPHDARTYAQVFTGVRQDSGDPADYVQRMRSFYDSQGITDAKTIVFSDSLDIDKCIEYKRISEKAGFQPMFGVGTYLTNDFVHRSTGKKSVPLNIVIKLSLAAGRPAVKISDNMGKNTGDKDEVERVKRELHYVEKAWEGVDEASRWGKED